MFDVNADFLLGAAVAVVVLVFVKWCLDTYRGFMKRINAPKNPQTVSHKTSKTPKEVVADGNRARWQLFVWVFVVLMSLYLVYEFFTLGTGHSLLMRVFG